MEAGTVARRSGQEGSRWVNYRPTGEEVASWFSENVDLHHEEMKHEDYVQGITLIQQEAEEKAVVGWSEDARPIIDKVKNLHLVPYAKVETRVKYFWDLIALNSAEGWTGFIEPVPPPKPMDTLPPGFGRLAVQTADNKVANFITCSMQAVIYTGDITYEAITNRRTGEVRHVRRGKIVMQGAPGTKMVPTLGRWGADESSLMKAETGAVGRALGLLGMLVVPGSGVATAEDVQEAQAHEGGVLQAAPTQTGEEAQLQDDDTALRSQITGLIGNLGEIDKPRLDRFRKWVREDRKIEGLADATSPQLRGLVRKLEQEIEEALQAKAEEETKKATGEKAE